MNVICYEDLPAYMRYTPLQLQMSWYIIGYVMFHWKKLSTDNKL